MSAKKHNKTYLGAWSKHINQKGAKVCILISIADNDDMHLNTLDIPKEALIPMLKDAIDVLNGSLGKKTVHEEIDK